MKKIFDSVAEKFDTDEKDVKKEISEAIHLTMKCDDPEKRENFRSLFPDGKEPTPEEFILAVAKEAIRRASL